MKRAIRGASSAALILGLAGGLQAAWAQQTVTTQQPDPQTAPQSGQVAQVSQPQVDPTGERVVITGSLIATTPEDAPKPVEVYSREELSEIGSPSVAEFIRDLSMAFDSDIGGLESSGDGVGETTGYAPANLRGLGDTGTLTLLNGRRLSTDNGVGADLNSIPSNALGRVEILRDGASTTYGAGAVGGVINLVTRRDIDAPEITVRHEAYDKSAGEWAIEAATGWVGDAGNVLLTYQYDKSHELRYNERDFSSLPFDVNPAGYTLDNGSYTLIENHLYNDFTGAAYPATFWLPGGTAGHTDPRRRMMDFTAGQCDNAGGDPVQAILPGARFSTTAGPNARLNDGCALPLSHIYSLVNEDEAHRAFAEVNLDINDDMEVTVNMLYSTLTSKGADAPSEQVSNDATLPFGVNGFFPSRNQTVCSTGCGFMIPVEVQQFNTNGTLMPGATVRNPFVDDFLTRGGLDPTAYGLGDALYVGPGWRPILWGGNPLFEDGRNMGQVQRERFAISAEVNGEFNSDGWLNFLNGVNYSYSAQFNKQQNTSKENYMLTSRLQNALMGYGGAGCQAADRVATDYSNVPAASTFSTASTTAANTDRAQFNSTIGTQSDTAPGTNGCLFFNPFNSSWETSLLTGADNSAAAGGIYGGAAYENPRELIDWLFEERTTETIRESLIFDLTWNGEIPQFELPGGRMAWAAGVNWRQTEYRQLPQGGTAATAMFQQPCAFPDPQKSDELKPTGEPDQYIGGAGCASATGPFTTSNRYLSRFADEQVFDYYGQIDLPVLDSLNFQASWRRTSLNDGRIEGDIWNVAGKYDITDNLYFRASYGTNFRAASELNLRPGSREFGFTLSGAVWGRVGNVAPQSYNVVSEELTPEDDRTLNIGFGYQNDDVFGGRLRASVDFFEIGLYDQVVGGSAASGMLTPAIDAVFRNPDGSVTVGTAQFESALADCNAPAAIFWGFNTPDKSCQPGVTGADVTEFYALTSNGGGFITNGIDYAVNYSIPAFGGRISADLRATQTLVYKDLGSVIGGVALETPASQLGYTGAFGSGSRSVDWRGTGTLRYSNDVHTVTLRGIFQTGQWQRGYLACLPPYFDAATNTQIGTVGGTSSCGTSLTAVRLDPATGNNLDDPTNGAIQFSDYGVRPEDRLTWDINYIYRPEFLEGMEFGASIENIFDEDPIASQTSNRGYVSGNPRGRIFQLEVTKRF